MDRNAPPDGWRHDLAAAVPDLDVSGSEWIANFNEATPWRAVVGLVRVRDGLEVVLKYHEDLADLQREVSAHRFLTIVDSGHLATRILGVNEVRKVVALERIIGPTLDEILNGPGAPLVWRRIAHVVGALHRRANRYRQTWLTLCADDVDAARLPVYDLPLDQLLTPLESHARDRVALFESISWVRRVVAEPGDWLGFTHSDLQTRHVVWSPEGPRFLDWERAGLRHVLYDLTCLVDKPGLLGRRVPRQAEEAAIVEYASAAGRSPDAVRSALAPVLAYERLIGLAEPPYDPVNHRICLEGLASLPDDSPNLAPLRDAAVRLLGGASEPPAPIFNGLSDFEDERA